MNKWVLTGLIIVVVLIVIGISYDQGLFDGITGAGWSILFATLAAPYMAVKNFLFGNRELKEFHKKYEDMQKDEIIHRRNLDSKIQAKEKRVEELDREIQLLDSKLEVLELKKTKVKKEVDNMSVDETRQEIVDLFGD